MSLVRQTVQRGRSLEYDKFKELFWQWKESDDPELRAELVSAYFPLVSRIAYAYARKSPKHVDVADLFQAGIESLFKALNTWDPEKGGWTRWAEGYITSSLRPLIYNRGAISLANSRLSRRITRAWKQNPNASVEEIAKIADASTEDVERHSYVLTPFSLEEKMGDSTQEGLASDGPSPEDETHANRLAEAARQFRETLSPDQKLLWDERIAAVNPTPVAVFQEMFGGITKQAVSSREQTIKKRFQSFLES